jgi:hypothetical protein
MVRNASSAGEKARSTATANSLKKNPKSLLRANVVGDAAMIKGQAKSIKKDVTYDIGLKYEQRLNRKATRSDYASERYKRHANEYARTDAIAKKYMTGEQYSKWSSSLIRNLYGKKVSSLKTKSETSREKVNQYIDKLSSRYTLAYDGSTKYYTLKVKG